MSPSNASVAITADKLLQRVLRGGSKLSANGKLDMAKYFSSYMLVYTHLAKTGGSSFVAGLSTIFGANHVYDLRGGFLPPHKLPREKRRQIWALSGHFWFDTQERAIAREKRYMISVRDPIDRFISLYNYVAEAKSHPGHLKYGVLSIEDAFEYLKANTPNAISNSISVMFGDRAWSARPRLPGRVVRPYKMRSFEEVCATMEKHYALVIPMKRVNDALQGLSAAFGHDFAVPIHHNVGTKKITELPEAIRQELREMNAVDYKLISHFEAVFEDRLKDLPARLLAE